ncbi:creatininase family protein [Thalassospira sp. NFXS8]|uniref:creatininase family protein n=1 Tax=Thalassospira sp. NFXS8 TaxID=2819093 RepID=UPI0032DEAC23
MTKHRIADMTAAEFAARTQEPTVILVPLGSQEVQGPHCPMGDYQLAERLAVMAAQDAGPCALVAPGLPFGYADFFRDVAGGMQLRPETFKAVLRDMLDSLLDHDLNRLLIFNGHTTNASLISQVVRDIRRDRGIMVPSLDIWKTIPDSLLETLFGHTTVCGHGGEPISSIALHLYPEQCRMDLRTQKTPRKTALGFPVRGVSGVTFEGIALNLPLNAKDVDENGLLSGSAALASSQHGEKLTQHIVGITARLIRSLLNADPENPFMSEASHLDPLSY